MRVNPIESNPLLLQAETQLALAITNLNIYQHSIVHHHDYSANDLHFLLIQLSELMNFYIAHAEGGDFSHIYSGITNCIIKFFELFVTDTQDSSNKLQLVLSFISDIPVEFFNIHLIFPYLLINAIDKKLDYSREQLDEMINVSLSYYKKWMDDENHRFREWISPVVKFDGYEILKINTLDFVLLHLHAVAKTARNESSLLGYLQEINVPLPEKLEADPFSADKFFNVLMELRHRGFLIAHRRVFDFVQTLRSYFTSLDELEHFETKGWSPTIPPIPTDASLDSTKLLLETMSRREISLASALEIMGRFMMGNPSSNLLLTRSSLGNVFAKLAELSSPEEQQLVVLKPKTDQSDKLESLISAGFLRFKQEHPYFHGFQPQNESWKYTSPHVSRGILVEQFHDVGYDGAIFGLVEWSSYFLTLPLAQQIPVETWFNFNINPPGYWKMTGRHIPELIRSLEDKKPISVAQHHASLRIFFEHYRHPALQLALHRHVMKAITTHAVACLNSDEFFLFYLPYLVAPTSSMVPIEDVVNFIAQIETPARNRSVVTMINAIKDFLSLSKFDEAKYRVANVPIFIVQKLRSTGEDFQVETFGKFINLYNKINDNAQPQHRLLWSKFLIRNLFKFSHLYETMGNNFFLFLRQFMGFTVQPLNRFFENYCFVAGPEKQVLTMLYQRYAPVVKGELVQTWIDILDAIGMCFLLRINAHIRIESHPQPASASAAVEQTQTTGHKDNRADDYALQIFRIIVPSEETSLSECQRNLRTQIMELFKRNLELDEDPEFDQELLLQKVNAKNFLMLLKARANMKKNYFAKIFDEMLKADFRKGTFSDFLRNGHDRSIIGSMLATHNRKIHACLAKYSINVDLALNYPNKMKFEHSEDGSGSGSGSDHNAIAYSMSTHLNEIRIILTSLPESKYVNPMRKLLDAVSKNINTSTLGETLLKPINQTLIQKIIANADNLFRTSMEGISEEHQRKLREHVDHLKDRNRDLTTAHRVSDKPSKHYHFRIEMWDKSQFDTYFLGHYWKCCLAPNSAQFPAMIQRRMDDAMMMAAIIDEDTGKTMAGAWLFFGEFEGKIYVVANFLEINARYNDTSLKETIINQLLVFIGEWYTPAINASGFLIRPLTYGLIADRKTHPMIPCKIEKVGGYLQIDNESDENSRQRYYLVATDMSELRKYRPSLQPRVLAIEKPIQEIHRKVTTFNFSQLFGSRSPTEEQLHKSVVEMNRDLLELEHKPQSEDDVPMWNRISLIPSK